MDDTHERELYAAFEAMRFDARAFALHSVAGDIRAAMLKTLRDVAQDASVSLEDAALLSVSLASAYADLCRLLDIEPPAPVAGVLGQPIG